MMPEDNEKQNFLMPSYIRIADGPPANVVHMQHPMTPVQSHLVMMPVYTHLNKSEIPKHAPLNSANGVYMNVIQTASKSSTPSTQQLANQEKY